MTEAPAARCPWCSAVLDRPGPAACPSCGAHLVEPSGVSVPGVTSIDTEALARSHAALRAPGGIVSMLAGGDEGEPPTDEELPALAPPDDEVRREILRMQLEAELASLTAQAHAIAAERGIPIEQAQTAAADAAAADAAAADDAAGAVGETPQP
jgi:hypothetical protein